MTELETRLSLRAHAAGMATDEGNSVAAPPATEEQFAAAEKQSGFPLPEKLRQMYRQIGNGGWGPGAGFLGLPAPEAGTLKSTAGLLPLVDWGGGITSDADCTRPEVPIIRRDPNMPKADVGERVPSAMHFDRAAQVKEACWVECPSLDEWLEAWADGASLFYRAYDDGTDSEEEDEEEGEEETSSDAL